MEVTQVELLQRLRDITHELSENVPTREAGRFTLSNEIAKINELRLRISRYGVTR